MTWKGERRADLPSNWSSTIVPAILNRDPTCQLHYPDEWQVASRTVHCTIISTEVDHRGDRRDHRSHMLRGVCHECHARRTREQSAQARGILGRLRPGERHPGLK
jgi:hypothetical protein